ncbi:MAG: sulfatase-like hydrolase/transferase [Planctomycetota bacterium]
MSQAARPCLLVLLWLLLAACSNEPSSVLLITLDTTRADRFGFAGREDSGTPVLDALAARGVAFDQAYTVAPITLPSHTSILTGTYPLYHGVRDNRRYRASPELDTLAEVLSEDGFQTGAFIGAFPLSEQFGLAQGFDTYDDETRSDEFNPTDFHFPERPAEGVVDAALEWMGSLDEDDRFFAWVHLFDAHADYQAPAPYGETFAEDPYQGEIAYMDAQIGRLIDELETSGRLEDTLIVVVGDHGEGLGEHGESTHTVFVYNSTMRVPLIVAGPGVPEGRRIRATCSVVDVLPTITEAIGVKAPKATQGTSLSALWESSSPESRAVFLESKVPELIYGWSPLESVVVGDRKLIRATAAGASQLYDPLADPSEEKDLAAVEPQRVEALEKQLERMRALITPARSLDAHADVSAAGLEKLRQLGYLSEVTVDPSEAGRDPHSAVEVLTGIERVMSLLGRRKFRRALALLDQLDPLDPDGARLLELRGICARELGRLDRDYYDMAIQALTESLKRNPGSMTGWLTLAEIHQELGNYEEAKQCRQEAFRSSTKRPEKAPDVK